MRALLRLLVCVVVIVAASVPAFAGTNSWSSIGPYGGTVEQLRIDPAVPSRMIAVSAGAVIVSADSGETWTEVFHLGKRLTALTGNIVVAAGPSRFYAAIDFNFLASSDGGKTWSTTPFGGATQLEVDALDSRLVYARARTFELIGNSLDQVQALMRSTDGGASWTRLPIALDGRSVFDVVADPKRHGIVYAGVIADQFGGGSTFFKSVDGGNHFADMQPGPPAGAFSSLAVDRVNPDVLYVTRLAEGRKLVNLSRSSNGGAAWEVIPTTLPGEYAPVNGRLALVTDPFRSGTLYHFTPYGFRIFRSVNYGSNWTEVPVANPRTTLSTFGVADLTRPDRYFAATNGGLFVSDDGVQWREITRGFASRMVSAVVIDEPHVTVASFTTMTATQRTSNLLDWISIDPSTVPLDSDPMARWVGLAAPTIASPPWSRNVYAIARSNGTLTTPGVPNTGEVVLYSSVDDGATWTTRKMAGDVVPNLLVAVSDAASAAGPQIMAGLQLTFGCGRFGSCSLSGTTLTLSRDGGSTWQKAILPTSGMVTSVAIPPVGNLAMVPIIFVGMTTGIARSSDGGASFQMITASAPPGRLLADPHHAGALYAWSNSRLYRSVDGGLTWSERASLSGVVDSSGISAIAFSELNADRIDVATRRGRLLRSNDGAENFVALTDGPPDLRPAQGYTYFGRHEPRTAYFASFSHSLSAYTIARDGPVDVVEFSNASLGHYFVTASAEEALGIDRGAAGSGWVRTGLGFAAWPGADVAPGDARPVCRFYGTPNIGPNSHFYTIDPNECLAVQRDRGWTLESTSVFHAVPPVAGQCRPGTTPVYRAYNNRFAQNDSNHRYSTRLADLQAMTASGWSVEGVALCSPAG